jgi:hypothetical protein
MADQDVNVFEEQQQSGSDDPNQSVLDTGNQADDQGQQDADDPVQKLLKGFTKEDGSPVYSSVDAVLEGLQAKENFIQQLKSENAAMREKLDASKGIDDVLAALSQNGKPDAPAPGTTEQQPAANAVTPQDLVKVVNQVLQQNSAQDIQKNNLKEFNKVCAKAYGNKAKKVFLEKAAEAGLTQGEVKDLAAKNPKLALKALGISQTDAQHSTFNAQSTVISDGKNHTQVKAADYDNKKDLFAATKEETLQNLRDQGVDVPDDM